jgi:hypothetical protein
MEVTNQRIRLAIDTARMEPINDVLTGNSPQFWNGVDLQFELALFRSSALVDIGNIDSIMVELKTSDSRTGLPLMSKVIASADMNPGLTLEDWLAGDPDDCHAKVQFTNAETNLYLIDDQVTFWLVISALTDDAPAHKITLGATPLIVIEDGAGVEPPASVITPTYYTAAQSDARYTLAVDLSSINTHLTTLDGQVAAAQATATAALPKAGGTMSGALTITGLSGVLKATAGLISGSATTSDLTEGSNLYFTNARADARITAARGAASGICPLDSSSLIPTTYLPALAISQSFVVASQAAMLALTAERGDIAIRTDLNKCFILSTDSPSTLADWKELLTPTSAVTSVNSQTGAVTLTTSNISEGSNLYYTTARAKADAIAALLTGFSSASGGTVSSGDTILAALGKLENRTALNDAKVTGSDRVKTDGTIAMTGMLNFSGTGHAGLKLNNLTSTQVTALTPAAGMLVYNTTTSTVQVYNGTWQNITGAGASGTTWLNGSGVPSGGTGSNGDYYLDTSNQDVYLKSGGSWSIVIAHGLSSAGGTMTGTLTFAASLNPAITFTPGYSLRVWNSDLNIGFKAGTDELAYSGFDNATHPAGYHWFIPIGGIDCRDGIWIGGTLCLNGQGGAVTDASGTLGSATSQLNGLLAQLRAIKILAP